MSDPFAISDIAFSVPMNGGEAPPAIVYLPEGTHTINATINGKPGTTTVHVDSSCLEAFQRDLERELARNVKPGVFFRHDAAGPRARTPSGFEYREGVGLLLLGTWTLAGKSAVENGEYTHFSPRCLFSADGKPLGLIPNRVEIGSLVNDPAFENIQRIAASKVESQAPDLEDEKPEVNPNNEDQQTATQAATEQKQNDKNMNEPLVKLGLVTDQEAEKGDSFAIAASKMEELKKKADKADALEKEVKAQKTQIDAIDSLKKQLAEQAITNAIAAGRIAPNDDAAHESWRAMLGVDVITASKTLSALPVNPAFVEIVAGKAIEQGMPVPTGTPGLVAAWGSELK